MREEGFEILSENKKDRWQHVKSETARLRRTAFFNFRLWCPHLAKVWRSSGRTTLMWCPSPLYSFRRAACVPTGLYWCTRCSSSSFVFLFLSSLPANFHTNPSRNLNSTLDPQRGGKRQQPTVRSIKSRVIILPWWLRMVAMIAVFRPVAGLM